MNYEKNLSEKWFNYIKSGKKIVEGRPFKGDFSKMNVGDTITFSNTSFEVENVIVVTITGVTRYKTFREYLEDKTLKKCLPDVMTIDEGVNVYYGFPNYENYEKDYGVVAFDLALNV